MRMRILSDLHVDFGGKVLPPSCGEDLAIIAGDAGEGLIGIEWAATAFPDIPVIYVPGNHEFYGSEYGQYRGLLREAAASLDHPAFHVLDDQAIAIDGIRFVGATLWSDYQLFGRSPDDVARAMAHCQGTMLDFRHIRVADADGEARLITPADTLLWHRRARQFMSLCLASGSPRETVVVTHHGPHRRSLAPRFAADLTSAGFLSDLGPLLQRAAIWVHGHTHTSFDYRIGDTRVVCNPRGYCKPDGTECENPEFRWDLMVDLPR